MTTNTLFIANWKMNKPFSQAAEFCKNHHASMISLSRQKNVSIAIAPDFIVLDHLAQSFASSAVHIGAQNCSTHQKGAYTGQVSAQSISDAGADFCIVGHSEIRAAYHQSNEDVAQAMRNVIHANMFPVVCIGQTEREQSHNQTFALLESQIMALITALKGSDAHPITLAYEPVWAIGTGHIPTPSDISDIFMYSKKLWDRYTKVPLRLIYGGSVNSTTIKQFKGIPLLEGFLVGSGSLEFQEFEKIVHLYMQ
ncbi:MAG: triose-phosphate isomerase [Candidatus Babeliales bacterium]